MVQVDEEPPHEEPIGQVVMRWATIYLASAGTSGALVEILSGAMRQSHLAVCRRDCRDGVRLEASTHDPWWKAVASSRLHHVTIEIRESTTTTIIAFDHRRNLLCRLIVLSCFIGAAALCLPAWMAVYGPSADEGLEVALVAWQVGGMAGLLMLGGLLLYRSGSACDRLWHLIRTEAHAQGISIELDLAASNSRALASFRKILAYAAVLIGAVAMGSLSSNHSSRSTMVVLLIVTAILGLVVLPPVVLLWTMHRYRGLNERLLPALQGFASAVTVIVCLSGMAPWLIMASRPAILWKAQVALDQMLAPSGSMVVGDPEVDQASRVSQSDLHRIQQFARVAFAMGPAFALIGLVIGQTIFTQIEVVITQAGRLHERHRLDDTATQAVTGHAFIHRFRTILCVYWVGTAVAISLLGSTLVAVATASLGLSVGDTGSSWAGTVLQTSITAAHLSLNTASTMVWVDYSVRAAWVVLATGFLALVWLSYGSLHIARRRAIASMMLDTHRSNDSDRSRLRTLTAQLAAHANSAMPEVVIGEYSLPQASSHVFGLVRHRKVVEVSRRALTLLSDDDLQALLAHEMSHLLLGHARRHVLLHYLGRLTFVGGGFVGVLEDSFGAELAADRSAVTRFNVSPQSLVSALMKMQAIAEIERLRLVRGGDTMAALGLASHPIGKSHSEPSGSSWFVHLRRNARLWCQLYCYEQAPPYWHPSVTERIEALRGIAGSEHHDGTSQLSSSEPDSHDRA